mgnify:FL=1
MKKVYFRADASANIGYGHFVRTLALADILKDNFDCIFFTCHPTLYQIKEMGKVCRYVALDSKTHFDDFLSSLQGDEIVVLDNYFYHTEYQREIKNKGCKLVCIDDIHDKHYVADVLINPSLTDVSLFDVEPYTNLCLGFEWMLLRKAFLDSERLRKTVNISNVCLCFGGSDYCNLTDKFINILLKKDGITNVFAIIGDKYPGSGLCSDSRVSFLHNLSSDCMVNIFNNTDLAILPTSTVCLEALACSTPVAAGYFVDNQIEDFINFSVQGLIYPLGNLVTLEEQGINWDAMSVFAISQNVKVNNKCIMKNYLNLFDNI